MAEIDSEKHISKIDQLEGSGANSAVSLSASEYGIDEKALLRKMDWKLLPAVSILYLLSFLDRSNVANAKVEGLTTDLNMTGNQYLTGLTLFFVGYILFEVPWNLVLRKLSPKIWLPAITLIWGIIATLLGVTQSLTGFFVARFFLGVAEGGLFPGVVFYLSMWYRRQERQFRIALFFSAASLAGAFGGILAFGIAHMNGVGGLHGWRWIFIIEGILTCVIAVAAFYFISSYPDKSAFLSDKEKEFVQRRIEADSDATSHEGFNWRNVSQALGDPKCWLYCLAYHTMSLPLYTLSLFLPTIIKSLGYTSGQAQLLTVPPYALATILTVVVATISERTRKRAPFIIGAVCVAIIGYIILLTNSATVTHIAAKAPFAKTVSIKHSGISYLGTFFCCAGIYPATALVLSWPAVNVSGATKRATAGGMQITIGNLGAVIGTQLYRSGDTPRFVRGHATALGYLGLNIVVVAVLWVVLGRENRRREALQQQGAGGVRDGKVREGDEQVQWMFTI